MITLLSKLAVFMDMDWLRWLRVEGKGQGQVGGLGRLGNAWAVPMSYYRCMEYRGQGAGMRENGGGGERKGEWRGRGGSGFFIHAIPLMLFILV